MAACSSDDDNDRGNGADAGSGGASTGGSSGSGGTSTGGTSGSGGASTGGSSGSGGAATGGTNGGPDGGGPDGGGPDGSTDGGGAEPEAGPDGGVLAQAIVFVSNLNTGDGGETDREIWLMSVSGQNRVQLTDNASNGDSNPKLSPDGTRIVWESTIAGNVDVWVMSSNGSNQVNLTESTTVNDGQPAWSPDGESIAFVSRRDNATYTKLFTMDDTGDNVVQRTLTDDNVIHPYWVGSNILYTSDRDGNQDIWVKADSDTANGTNRTAARTQNDTFGAFSPDGQKIVFASIPSEDGGGTDSDIFVMDADGMNVVQLTDNDAEDTQPSWSPDGTKIVFRSNRAGTQDIWVMDANGENPVNLTPDLDSTNEQRPHWGYYVELQLPQ